MGVRGLTTFINRQKRFYEDYALHSTKLVIDGRGVARHIYLDTDLDIDPGSHGGEHQTYSTHCTQFFRNMLACGVECYVIFDGEGSCNKDGLKFETLKTKEQQSIDLVKGLNETGEGWRICAESHREVFNTVMDDLGIKYFYCEFEADRDIAILANEFKCPVLGQHSDFFIMNIHEGYIPLDHLYWEKLCRYSSESAENASYQPRSSSFQANQNFLQCVRFRLRTFCTYYQVMPSMMPLFASLSDSDCFKSFSFKEFYEGIKYRHWRPDGRPHPHRLGYWRFCDLLHHLTFFTTVEECIDEVLKYVDVDKSSKVKAVLKEACSMYDVNSYSHVVQFFREQITLQPDEIPAKDLQNSCTVEITTDEDGEEDQLMPAICKNILHQRPIFLSVKKEDLSEPRVTACCDHLLRILAGMMLKNESAEEAVDESRKLTIDVFHRERYTLACTKMEPEWDVAGFGKVPYYKEIPRMTVSSRRSLLLAALNIPSVSFTNIPESFHLLMLASLYCCVNANPPVSQDILHALALGWIQGVAWFQDNTYRLHQEGRRHTQKAEFGITWGSHEVQVVIQNYGPLTRKSLRKGFDFEASHAFMQWLSCNTFTTNLNFLLQNVLPTLDVRICYNGILMHNLYCRLQEVRPCKHQDWIKNDLMLDAPIAYKFYQDIMSFFNQNLTFPADSNEGSWSVPSKVQHNKGTQTEIQGHDGTPSKGPREAGTSNTSSGSSGKKKHRGSRKIRGGKK